MSLIKSLLIACVVMLMPAAILAQTNFRWVGTTSGDWNTPTNWLDDTSQAAVVVSPNATNHSAIFRQASSNTTLSLASQILLQNIQYTASPSAYIIGGQGITFTSGGSVSVASTVATTQTINSNITTDGPLIFNNDSMTSGQSLVFGGTVTGSGAITKTGNGVVTLGGTNSGFSGAVNVNAGTLQVTGTTGTGTVTVNTGGTLAGTGKVTGATTVVALGGTIRGDSGTGTGNLLLSGNTTLNGSPTGSLASNIRTSLAVSSGTINSNSKLSLVGGTNVLNLDNVQGTTRNMNVYLDNDSGLILNKAYTITLAIADTNSLTRFERNGGNGTQLYTASDINLFSGTNSYTFTNVQLSRGILGSNTLDITFTAVPEPSLLFGAAVGLIGLVGVRKKLFKQP